MNKKVLGLGLASIFLAMLIAPVIAGKGTDIVDFTFTFDAQQMTIIPPVRETGETAHIFATFDLGENGMVHLVIDGEDYYSYGTAFTEDSDFTYYSEMTVEVHKALSDPDKDFGNLHWWYTLDFGGDDVITIKCNGKNYRTTPATSWANIVGFGTGIFEDIKLKGTAGNDETGLITHWGTIMDWPL